MASSASPGSSKRARPPVLRIQTIACSVDGCTADLSKCRDYHRRHRVCEPHSKTRTVTIGGNEQRFCQQCSRFHSVVEFDEGKRSCRKRLDGHNRRRRKPQPETFSVNTGTFFSTHQGTKYLNFGTPQIFRTSAMGNSDWVGPVKAEEHAALYNSHSSTGAYSHSSYRGGNQQPPFPQGELCFSEASPAVQPFLDPKCASGYSRARSLLSSSLAGSGENGLGSCFIPLAQQPLVPGLSYQQQCSALASDAEDLSCQDMLPIGPNEPSSGGPHHTLSFSWD